ARARRQVRLRQDRDEVLTLERVDDRVDVDRAAALAAETEGVGRRRRHRGLQSAEAADRPTRQEADGNRAVVIERVPIEAELLAGLARHLGDADAQIDLRRAGDRDVEIDVLLGAQEVLSNLLDFLGVARRGGIAGDGDPAGQALDADLRTWDLLLDRRGDL